jgi:hypothetical protein
MSEEIKSRAYTAQGRDNWENIFGKKSAHEWIEFLYGDSVFIINPDGWDQEVTLDTPITRRDFNFRLSVSTIQKALL